MVLVALACGRTGPEAGVPGVETLPRPGHATEWRALVAAAERGDVATARTMARDLSLGDVPEDHPAAEELGAALGYLQIAEGPDDVREAVREAEAACEACHRDRR